MTGTILQANKGLDEAITAKDFFFSMMRIHKLCRHLRFEATIPNFLEEHDTCQALRFSRERLKFRNQTS